MMPPPDAKDSPIASRVAVVGVNGFLGRHVARAAHAASNEVVGFARTAAAVDEHERRPPLAPIVDRLWVGDARDPAALAALIEDFRPQVLVAAAGVARRTADGWLGGNSANHEIASATVTAVTGGAQAGQPFVVWVGSQAEYGTADSPWTEATRERPTTPYGTSKLMASSLILGAIRAKAMRGCIVRAPIVFGQGQSSAMFVVEAICSALAGRRFRMTQGEQTRRLVYAPDLAATLLEVGMRGRTEPFPSLLNAPSYPPTTIRQVAGLIDSLLPDQPGPDIGAIPYRSHEAMDAWPATDLATSLSLSVKTPLEEALAETVAWYRGNEWFWRDDHDG